MSLASCVMYLQVPGQSAQGSSSQQQEEPEGEAPDRKVYIKEDLTTMRAKLHSIARKNDKVKKAITREGKVFVT